MAELRQRSIPLLYVDNGVKEGDHIRSKLANVDIFNKPKEGYIRTQTPWGSKVSAVSLCILSFLLVFNVIYYVMGISAYRTELSIEANHSGYMEVNMDIDFLATPCHRLRVDLADSAGTVRRNLTHHVHKIPLKRSGRPAFSGTGFYDVFSGELMYNSTLDPDSPSYCGRCIVSGDEELFLEQRLKTTCCNSCDDVMSFYKLNSVEAPQVHRVHQCLNEISLKNPGCKVSGSLRLKRVRGALIFGPKGNLNNGPMYSIGDFFGFDSTHRINSFFFGRDNIQRFPRSDPPLLNGRTFKSSKIEQVHYMLNIVPTNYVINSISRKQDEQTFEYSARIRSAPIYVGAMGIPSVTFYFDLSPIKITNIFEREEISQFLIHLCGIVGGVFVISALVDDAIQCIERRKNRFRH